MPGIENLRRVQLGWEGTPGTAVAATALLHFNGVWQDATEVMFPDIKEGNMGGEDTSYIAMVLARLALAGEASFEELPYILEMAVVGATPTTDTGTGVQYVYPLSTTAQQTPATATIEAGDDQAMEESAHCYVRDFQLSGAFGEAWQLSGNVVGRQIVDTDTFTPSTDVTNTDIEIMLFQKTKLYIDADTDAIGTTQKSQTLLRAQLNVVGGKSHQHTGDGNLYYSFVKDVDPEVTLDITFEHDGTATAEKTAWRAQTPRLIRLLIEGSALTTPDTYTVKSCIIDLAGKWETFDSLDSINGNDVVRGRFRAKRNRNASLFAQITVVNELTALP